LRLKTIIMVLLLFCVAVLLHLLALPWWVVMAVIFAMSFLKPAGAWQTFRRGFLAVFITWLVLNAWASWQNDHILAARVGLLFGMPHWTLLVIASALLGGIAAGLAGMSGHFLHAWLMHLRAKYVGQ
jgi:hypothetical protein